MTDYALALDEAEVARYGYMARQAATHEAAQRAGAGFVAGGRVADMGCGPGAVSVVLAELVGPTGM